MVPRVRPGPRPRRQRVGPGGRDRVAGDQGHGLRLAARPRHPGPPRPGDPRGDGRAVLREDGHRADAAAGYYSDANRNDCLPGTAADLRRPGRRLGRRRGRRRGLAGPPWAVSWGPVTWTP